MTKCSMDIHDRYTYEIRQEIALLKTGKANYAIQSRLLITIHLKFRTSLNECRSHGKTIALIATTVEYTRMSNTTTIAVARMNSYKSGNWQEVLVGSVDQRTNSS